MVAVTVSKNGRHQVTLVGLDWSRGLTCYSVPMQFPKFCKGWHRIRFNASLQSRSTSSKWIEYIWQTGARHITTLPHSRSTFHEFNKLSSWKSRGGPTDINKYAPGMKVNSIKTWKRKVSETCQAAGKFTFNHSPDARSSDRVCCVWRRDTTSSDWVKVKKAFKVLSWNSPGWLRKTTKILRIVGVLAENRMGHLSTQNLCGKWASNILLEWRNNHW